MTTLGIRILRAVFPQQEKDRQEYRMLLSRTMAGSEDIERTITAINGHAPDHPLVKAWTKRRQSAP